VGEGDARTGFGWGDLRAREHLEDPDVDRRIISKRILKKSVGRSWTGLIWLKIGIVSLSCERSIELSDSIKLGEFLE